MDWSCRSGPRPSMDRYGSYSTGKRRCASWSGRRCRGTIRRRVCSASGANSPSRPWRARLSTDSTSVASVIWWRRGDLLRSRGGATCESDLKPADRYLMERFVTAGFAAHGEVVRRPGHLEMRNPAIRRDDYRCALRWVLAGHRDRRARRGALLHRTAFTGRRAGADGERRSRSLRRCCGRVVAERRRPALTPVRMVRRNTIPISFSDGTSSDSTSTSSQSVAVG